MLTSTKVPASTDPFINKDRLNRKPLVPPTILGKALLFMHRTPKTTSADDQRWPGFSITIIMAEKWMWELVRATVVRSQGLVTNKRFNRQWWLVLTGSLTNRNFKTINTGRLVFIKKHVFFHLVYYTVRDKTSVPSLFLV